MDLIHVLLKSMLATGATWILWLLIGLSVFSIAIILERAYIFHKLGNNLVDLGERLITYLEVGELEKARQMLVAKPGIEAKIAYEGLRAFEKGPESVAEAMASAKAIQRVRLEDHLAFLGTLGNNAPFIGLFGTVVGIIKAFHDLSMDNSGAAKAVMSGISEALVATAMGLFVAIPAVLAFNYFQRRIRSQLAAADGLTHLILAELRRETKRPALGSAPVPAAATRADVTP